MNPEIIAFGEPLFEFSKIKHPQGEGDFKGGFGGDVSNFAISAARQGASVGMLCHIGNDSFGRAFTDLWKQENVDISNVVVNPDAFTGVYYITYDEKGHHFDFMRKGSAASLVMPIQLPEKPIANAKLLHVSGISHAISANASDTVFTAIEIAKQHNTLVSFDTNLRLKLWGKQRAKATIDATAGMSDICFPSIDEAMLLTGLNDPDAIIDYYLKLGAKLVVLKLADKGAIAATSSQRIRVAGNKATLVDATGAGDTFAGAFCYNYLQKQDITYCLKYANMCAALSIQGYGAIDPIPSKDEVLKHLAKLG